MDPDTNFRCVRVCVCVCVYVCVSVSVCVSVFVCVGEGGWRVGAPNVLVKCPYRGPFPMPNRTVPRLNCTAFEKMQYQVDFFELVIYKVLTCKTPHLLQILKSFFNLARESCILEKFKLEFI